jgi:hypothetical protein
MAKTEKVVDLKPELDKITDEQWYNPGGTSETFSDGNKME